MDFNELLMAQKGKRQGIQKTPMYLDDDGVAFWSDEPIPDTNPNKFKVSFGGRTVTLETSPSDNGRYTMEYNEVTYYDDGRNVFLGVYDGKYLNARYLSVTYDDRVGSASIVLNDSNDSIYKVIKCNSFEDMIHNVQDYLESICVYGPKSFEYKGCTLEAVEDASDISHSTSYSNKYNMEPERYTTYLFSDTDIVAEEYDDYGEVIKEGYSDFDPADPVSSFIKALDDLH